MYIEQFAKQVELLRDVQKKYFKTRDKFYLLESIKHEKAVDASIRDILKMAESERQFMLEHSADGCSFINVE